MVIFGILLWVIAILIGLIATVVAYQKTLSKEAVSLKNIHKKIMYSRVSDWKLSDIDGIYVYKKDANLTIRREDFEKSRSFHESWLKCFADSKGHTNHHFVFYANTQIERVRLVSVDGARCLMPYPNPKDMSISPYQLGKIINDSFGEIAHFDFDGYLNQANIKVSKQYSRNGIE